MREEKKIFFTLCMVGLVVFASEALSFTTMSLIKQQLYTYSDIAATQNIRWENKHKERVLIQSPGSDLVLHPYLGYVIETENPVVDKNSVRTNMSAFGYYRDSGEMVTSHNDNEVVIGIFGGSVARNFGRAGRSGLDTLTSQLRTLPQYANKEFIFAVPALGGYKQPQQLLALSYFLSLGAVFDIVINIDGFNEVTLSTLENIPKGIDPFYPRGWFFLSQKEFQPPFQELISEIIIRKRNRTALAQKYNRAPIRYSYSLMLLWHVRDHFMAKELYALRIELEEMHNLEQLSYPVSGPRHSYEDDMDLMAALVTEWQRSSLQMHRLSEANNIRYFHFLQPNQYVKGSKPFTKVEAAMNSVYKPYVEKGYPLLRETGQDLVTEGVNFYDMTMVFSDHPESLYIDDCCHFLDDGNAILGDAIGTAIAEYILQNK